MTFSPSHICIRKFCGLTAAMDGEKQSKGRRPVPPKLSYTYVGWGEIKNAQGNTLLPLGAFPATHPTTTALGFHGNFVMLYCRSLTAE